MINDNEKYELYARLQLDIADAVQNIENLGSVFAWGKEMARLQTMVDELPQQPDDANGFTEEEILDLHKTIFEISKEYQVSVKKRYAVIGSGFFAQKTRESDNEKDDKQEARNSL